MRTASSSRSVLTTVQEFGRSVGCRTPELAAMRICDRHVASLGRKTPPFQTKEYEYAKLLGVTVIEDTIPYDGMLSSLGDRFIIQVNKNASPERRSFTVCHELGHFEIYRQVAMASQRTMSCILTEANTSRNEEQLANFFASNLLMPRTVFREQARDCTIGFESVRRLAGMFGTSLEATARRLVDLRLWPCVVIWCHEEKYGPNDTGVKIDRRHPQLRGSTPIDYISYLDVALPAVQAVGYNRQTIASRTILFPGTGASQDIWRFECVAHSRNGMNGAPMPGAMALLWKLTPSI